MGYQPWVLPRDPEQGLAPVWASASVSTKGAFGMDDLEPSTVFWLWVQHTCRVLCRLGGPSRCDGGQLNLAAEVEPGRLPVTFLVLLSPLERPRFAS